jgi:hypothetical protein
MSSTADAGPRRPGRRVQARGRSGDIEDAITLIDGLRALPGHDEP